MCIAVDAKYVQITGSPAAGILLSQLCYWADKSKKEWFYKTQIEWSKETGLTRYMIDGAQKLLLKLGLIQIEKRGIPAKNYYRVNFETIQQLVDNFAQDTENQTTSSGKNRSLVRGKADHKYVEKPSTGGGKNRSQVVAKADDLLHKITTKNTHKTTHKITTEDLIVSQKLDQVVDKKTVVEIFEHWKEVMGHTKAQLDDKRRSLIRKALKMGYSQVQLFQAIDGCAITPHNIGENDRGQRYDGLHILFRSADQIDRFMRNAERPPRILNKAQQSEAHNDRVVGNVLRQLATGEMAL